jgi:hypothetical protein
MFRVRYPDFRQITKEVPLLARIEDLTYFRFSEFSTDFYRETDIERVCALDFDTLRTTISTTPNSDMAHVWYRTRYY